MRRLDAWLGRYGVVAALVALLAGAGLRAERRPHLDERAQEALDYLESQAGTRALLGYNMYVHTPDVYEQTGKRAAILGRDLRWLGEAPEVIDRVNERGALLTIHWHWHFADDSAWGRRRKEPVSLERMLNPDTKEHEQLQRELAWAADRLQPFAEAGLPVLWRPLHEIDGGWFWWTDKEQPERTAELWRTMFRYLTEERGFRNLIWVYSAAGAGREKEVSYRQRFYPGPEYVDVSGIDIYGVDYKTADPAYWKYYGMMKQVSPGKLLALSECDALPDPELMASGELPLWSYIMPWWGTPSEKRDVEWARYTTRHRLIGTLGQMPPLGYEGLPPVVGLLSPKDDGSARYEEGAAVSIEGEAVDRDGEVGLVEILANGERIGQIEAGEGDFRFRWSDAPRGFHELRAMAYDESGRATLSNSIRVLVGVENLAEGGSVQVSSGEGGALAVDGNLHTAWKAEPSDPQWIRVDLGKRMPLKELVIVWGFRSNGEDFAVDFTSRNPDRPASWRKAYRRTDRSYQAWKAMDRVDLSGRKARHLRLRILDRAGEWSGEGTQVAELIVIGAE